MLDLGTALRELKYLREIHIVAVNNECKELIALLKKPLDNDYLSGNEIRMFCEQAVNNLLTTPFSFTLSEERNAVCTWAEEVEDYCMNREPRC